MLDIPTLGTDVATRRKALGLRQADVCEKAGVSRATLDALENGRIGELGFAKISRVLAAVGLELTLSQGSGRRPTLEDLMREDDRDQGMGRRD